MSEHDEALIPANFDSGDEDTPRHPLQAHMERCFSRKSVGVDQWQEEVMLVGRMAAMSSDFKSSAHFYEMAGNSIGANPKGAVQQESARHLHLHGLNSKDMERLTKEASTEDLEATLYESEAQAAAQQQKAAPQPESTQSDDADYLFD